MRIDRSTDRDGNLFPEVLNVLAHLPNAYVHHLEHRVHHPQEVFELAFRGVLNSMREVLADLAALPETATPREDTELQSFKPERLMRAQKALIGDLAAYTESCFTVLKSLHPPSDVKEIRSKADQAWLQKAKNPVVDSFNQKIKPQFELIRQMNNSLKHGQGRLAPHIFFGERLEVAGYYLSTVLEDGVRGPDPDVHSDNTALSFHRDLRQKFIYLYIVGKHLSEAVTLTIKARYGERPPKGHYVGSSQLIPEIAIKLSKLSYVFFPDEVKRPVPSVLYRENGGQHLILSSDSGRRAKAPESSHEVTYGETGGRGGTVTIRLPYLKRPS